MQKGSRNQQGRVAAASLHELLFWACLFPERILIQAGGYCRKAQAQSLSFWNKEVLTWGKGGACLRKTTLVQEEVGRKRSFNKLMCQVGKNLRRSSFSPLQCPLFCNQNLYVHIPELSLRLQSPPSSPKKSTWNAACPSHAEALPIFHASGACRSEVFTAHDASATKPKHMSLGVKTGWMAKGLSAGVGGEGRTNAVIFSKDSSCLFLALFRLSLPTS